MKNFVHNLKKFQKKEVDLDIFDEASKEILIELYDKNNGDLDSVFDELECSNLTLEDIMRYSQIIISLLQNADESSSRLKTDMVFYLRNSETIVRKEEFLF